ncbi:hypothetical protein [Rhodococcus sp. NPDC059234]|uniref:hypothetical protein n=1 Tax=Rhodococcus sp. NPDC059234 TaxID=3346781 RepID=UPI00366CCE9C
MNTVGGTGSRRILARCLVAGALVTMPVVAAAAPAEAAATGPAPVAAAWQHGNDHHGNGWNQGHHMGCPGGGGWRDNDGNWHRHDCDGNRGNQNPWWNWQQPGPAQNPFAGLFGGFLGS